MSAGIVSFGAYIPVYRLPLETLGAVWGGGRVNGEKAVANCDEDSLTMAVEALTDCMKSRERGAIDSLYFATTTPPYREKQSASIIAKVMDLRRDILTADICNSVRGATIALRMALDGVNAASTKACLVAGADCRIPAPDSDFERFLGDGSAALLIGNSDVAVEVEGYHTTSSEFIDIWRKESDLHPRTWEDRFVVQHGYFDGVTDGVTGLFNKYHISASDFAKVVMYGFNLRSHAQIHNKLGFAPAQIQDPLFRNVGHTGAASVLMMLVACLEDSKPGDRILLVSYGDGVDAFMLKVTDYIERLRDRRGIKRHLASKMILPNYGRYLHFRNLTQRDARLQPDEYASLPMSWRDRDWILSCHGNRCKNCGKIMFPPQKICSWCQASSGFESIRLSENSGILVSYSTDSLAVSADPPNVIAVVDLEGGGRFLTLMTDRDPERLFINMPVELSFRKIHEAKGIQNYFWKCRPIRSSGSSS